MSRGAVSRNRRMRLVAVPAALLLLVSAATFTLAKLSLAKPEASSGGAGGRGLGDAYRGEIAFSQTCAGCHGEGGKGGGIGPRLAGNPISLAEAKARIDGGGSVMPAGLVSGDKEADVLAYLATILGK